MTAQLMDMAADHELAETVGDAALVALLRNKPASDGVPAAVWWLIAESLRTSVAIRRTITSEAAMDRSGLEALLTEATLLTDAALAELAETTGARPTPMVLPAVRAARSREAPTRPAFGLQLSVLFLARLLVSSTPTTPLRLANTLAAHLRALAGVKLSLAAA
jgi:hypothetical protein